MGGLEKPDGCLGWMPVETKESRFVRPDSETSPTCSGAGSI